MAVERNAQETAGGLGGVCGHCQSVRWARPGPWHHDLSSKRPILREHARLGPGVTFAGTAQADSEPDWPGRGQVRCVTRQWHAPSRGVTAARGLSVLARIPAYSSFRLGVSS
jgi:hypothetical protein